ncbi:MAG: 5-formyltetrahydrofolate cyclo-ligase [Oscillospiraceae bacterium]
MNINDRKKLLREDFKNIRKSLDNKSDLDNQIFENLIKSVDFSKFKSVIVYVSFGLEVDTLALIEYLRERNVDVYSPRCYIQDKSMKFFNINKENSLVKGAYNILEPVENSSNELIDFSESICIVPALSFDRFGYRLGWGGGYYDRFLALHKDIFKLGLVYSSCLSDTLPKDDYDISVDMVLTEKIYYYVEALNEY